MTVREWLALAQAEFRKQGHPEPRSESEMLLTKILEWPRVKAITEEAHGLTPQESEMLFEALRRRLTGEPLAYVVGYKDFYKSRFLVGPGVLVPRPETELIVEAALKLFPITPLEFADFGAGTGCIGLSLLKEWPSAKLIAVEKSGEAVSYLERNIAALDLKARVQVIQKPVEQLDAMSLDLIVANPPYISFSDPEVEPNVRRFEPPEALYADDRGLAAIVSWVNVAAKMLEPGGHMIVEIGHHQAETLRRHSFPGLKVTRAVRDLSGYERVVVWTKDL